MKISVIITLMNDRRVINTIESLLSQSLFPNEIFVAYAGNDEELYKKLKEYGGVVRVKNIYGSVAESRNKTMSLIESDIDVFVDSDEVAPETYIERLTKPIRERSADFTGAYYKPLHPARNSVERYLHLRAKTLTHKQLFSPRYIPMGCSAWRHEVFDTIGNFDTSINTGGEDYDINLRALNAGFKGYVLPDVFLYHDLHFDSWYSYIKKMYSYHKGSLKAYKKNNVGISIDTFHPFKIIDFSLKVLAYINIRRGGI